MADKKEAVVKFKADTADFDSNIKSLNSSMSSLRAELRLNATEMKGTGETVDSLKRRQEILSQELQTASAKVETLTEKHKMACDVFGENSDEANRLAREITYAQNQEQAIANDIQSVNDKLAEHAEKMAEAETETGKLTSTISEQEKELAMLKDQYVEAVLKYGETSTEATTLGDSIKDLSSNLNDNKDKLEKARKSAESLGDTMEETASETNSSGSLIDSAWEKISGTMMTFDVGQLVSVVIDKVVELGKAAIECAQEYDESMATIAQGTGATGEALEQLTEAAYNTYKNLAIAGESAQSVADVLAEVNTRFGESGDEATQTTAKFEYFAKVTGGNAKASVDQLADVMKRWGDNSMSVDDLMDDLVTSSQACGKSADELGGYLDKNAYQWQELGYSQQEALGFMSALAWNGAELSTVSSGLTNAIKNLNGETDDVPGAFQDAIEAIVEADDMSEALNATVGDTGKTVEEVFGKRVAQELVGALQTGNGSIEVFTNMLNDNGLALEQTAEDSITLKDKFTAMKNQFVADGTLLIGSLKEIGQTQTETGDASEDAWERIQTTVTGSANQTTIDISNAWAESTKNTQEKWQGIKTTIGEKWQGIKTNIITNAQNANAEVAQRWESFKTTASEKWQGINTAIGLKWDSLKTTAGEKWDAVKTTVSNAIEGVKGLVNFEWSLPHIKTPHFIIHGGQAPWGWMGKGTFPSVEVNFFKKALRRPVAFTGGTLLPAINGGYHVYGEAGTEILTGIDPLEEMGEKIANEARTEIDYTKLSDMVMSAVSSIDWSIEMDGRRVSRLRRAL